MDHSRRQFLRRTLTGASVAAASYRRILGANDRISVAVIGCGDRELLKEAVQFSGATNSRVTAVCDTWKQMRERAAALVKEGSGGEPRQFIHYQDVLRLPDIDAVVIGAPDHQHCTMLAAAARAGKDAYIEKPIAMNMRELIEAVDAVKKHGRVCQTGTQGSSNPHAMAARAFVASGGLGRILKVEQARNSYRPYWHRYAAREVRESDVDWKAFLMHVRYRPFDADQYAGWYGYREFSHGPHTGLMAHFINYLRVVTGATIPRRVVSLGGIYRWKDSRTCPDSIETVLEYPEGFLARYCTVFGNGANNYTKFFGTRGVIDASRSYEPWKVSGEGSQDADRIQGQSALVPAEATHHMRNFLECVRSRREPRAPIDSGYAHGVACLMADESYVRGVRMTYDPAKRTIQPG